MIESNKLNRDFFERYDIAGVHVKSFFEDPEKNYIYYKDIAVFLRIFLLDDYKTKNLLYRYFKDELFFNKINVINSDVGWDEVYVKISGGDYKNLPTASLIFRDPKEFTKNTFNNFFNDEYQILDEWLNTKSLFCGCITPYELIKGTCDKEGAHSDNEYCKIIEQIDSHIIGTKQVRLRYIILFYVAYYVLCFISENIKIPKSANV